GLARFFSRHAQRQNDWDGMWRLLTIAGFNKSDYDNQYIVDEFMECGLREINNNVWATPYAIDEAALALLDARGFLYLKITGSIQPNSDSDRLLNGAFDLVEIREKYAAFLRKADEVPGRMAHLHGGALLPILFELGWDFYDATTSDPALPKALLPEWEGDRAAAQMKTLRPLLVNEITRYLKANNLLVYP
ncbi:MAG: PaaX family transcriptional regulator C-terminal domain-containing protein, partial [Bacillota bacterium]